MSRAEFAAVMFVVIPSWVLVRLSEPYFPATHPWKGRKFTLRDWAEHSTLVNVYLSAGLWFSIEVLVIMGVRLWLGR